MLPLNSCIGAVPRGHLYRSHSARVVPACHAHLPHHRLQITSTGLMLPQRRQGRHRPLMAPLREPSAAGQVANWLLTGQWKHQLATAAPEVLNSARTTLQAVCLVLAATYQQAQSLWQYVLAHWPAWQASLQEDAEIVFEYALGLIPAWLSLMHASIMQLCQDVTASEPVQQLTATAAAAAATAHAGAMALCTGVQQGLQDMTQMVVQHLGPGHSSQRPAMQHLHDDEQRSARRSAASEAAKVAYSLAWFGFGPQASTLQHQLSHHAQQHMSLHDWQQLQEEQEQHQQQQAAAPIEPAVRPRRWKTPERRGWVDRVASRALKGSGSVQQPEYMHHKDHLWRSRHAGWGWTAPVHCITGALQSVQGRVQGCVEAVAATGTAAAAGVQRASCVVVAPVQRAVQTMSPPPAGVMVAGALLLAGAAANAVSRRQHEAAQLAQQQQQLMKQRAEELRAQKARIMGVLSVEVPGGSSSSSRRKGAAAAAPSKTSIPVVVAGADTGLALEAADTPAEGSSRWELEMDQEAAAMWKKFLAGSRATDVPMWNNRMVEDLPKVSRKEVDRQTQKIRSAAAPEERAALEQADMEQLTQQLQQLDHAPLGRKARAAWLKEQQQLKQQQQQQQPPQASPDQISSTQVAAARATNSQDIVGSGGAKAVDRDNPFAISPEVRANWDYEGDDTPVLPPPRKATIRAGGSGGSSRSNSRSGSRSGSAAADGSSSGSNSKSSNSNPFAISRDVRAQWEAEDHLFSEPAPKPLLGSMIGGLLTAFTSGKAQPDAAQQHQQRRRQQLKAEEAEAATMLRLQQQQQAQNDCAARMQGPSPPPLEQKTLQMPPKSGVVTSGAALLPEGAVAAQSDSKVVEGSPEWNDKVRQDMLRTGAARRARMLQMQQHAATGKQPVSSGRQQVEADAGKQARSAEGKEEDRNAAGIQQQRSPPTTAPGSGVVQHSSLAAAVSAVDAQGVTAAVPIIPPSVRGSSTAAPTAGAAAAATGAGAAAASSKVSAGSRGAIVDAGVVGVEGGQKVEGDGPKLE